MDASNYDNYAEDFAQKYADTEEEKPIPRQNFRKVARKYQMFEVALAVLLVSWLLLRFKITAIILGELLRRLLDLIRYPFVMFCSVAYLAFMVNCYRVSAKNIAEDNAGNNICENIVDMGRFQEMVQFEEVGAGYEVHCMECMPLSVKADEAVYEDKEIVCVLNITRASTPAREVGGEAETSWDSDVESPRVNRRGTHSQNLELEVNLQRRSEAETFESMEPEEVLPENSCPTDKLNDDQFKETIDAFIKRQHQFRSHEILYDYYGDRRKHVCVPIN